MRNLVQDSVLLSYKIDLAVAGFDDSNLKAHFTIHDRRRLLLDAERVWRGSGQVHLSQTLVLDHLEYWPIRDSVLLTKVNSHDNRDGETNTDIVTFDVTRISSSPSSSIVVPPSPRWRIRLRKGVESIACIDPNQDLLAVRIHRPPSTTTLTTNGLPQPSATEHWYHLVMYSLSSGKPHPRAQQQHIRFKMSRRVVKNPHYTRVHVLDNTLSVNMASGFQLFTETTFFDWTTGNQKAVRRPYPFII